MMDPEDVLLVLLGEAEKLKLVKASFADGTHTATDNQVIFGFLQLEPER